MCNIGNMGKYSTATFVTDSLLYFKFLSLRPTSFIDGNEHQKFEQKHDNTTTKREVPAITGLHYSGSILLTQSIQIRLLSFTAL